MAYLKIPKEMQKEIYMKIKILTTKSIYLHFLWTSGVLKLIFI